MIFTLGVNAVMRGLMVAHTGGFAPADRGDAADAAISPSGASLGDPERALRLAGGLGLVVVLLLTRTPFGRAVYAIGNRERAAYLVGHRHQPRDRSAPSRSAGMRRASPACCSPATRPRPIRAWATPICCPAIAAVVIGGTNILGGRGRYLGTVVGVILIVLLNSVLSIMQMPEAGPADHLRRRHHRHAAGLRPLVQGDGVMLFEPDPLHLTAP